MGFNLKLPPGFRFDPTDEEILLYLQWRLYDLNDNRFAFIPNIRMQDHDPSEFPWLGTVTGKDGIFYFFAVWDKKYLKGKRLDRRVKKDSMKGRWKEGSSETIKSSDGTQIGTRKNLTFLVDGSLTDWHMEEYRLCTPEHEHSKVSICTVSKKCSKARGTTKIDAKVDIRFGEQRHFDHVTEVTNCPKSLQQTHSAAENSNGEEEGQPYWCNICSKWYPYDESFHRSLRNLCNRLHDKEHLLFWLNSILEGFECECPLPNVGRLGPQANNSKGKKEAGQSCIGDTGNGPERETFDMDSGREINKGQKDDGPPCWCKLCSGLYAPKETGYSCRDNLLATSAPLNSILEGFECECAPPNVVHLGPQANNSKGKKEVGQSCIGDTGNGPERETLDMDSGREINKGQKDGGPPCWCKLCSGLYAPKETGYYCRDNLLTTPHPLNVDNPDTGNCQSANDTVLDMNDMTEMVGNLDTPNRFLSLDDNCQNWSNPAEEYVDNPDTGNCQSANDTVLDMNDVTEMLNCFLSPDHSYPICSKAAEEYVDNPDTGNCQSADDTVPMDMDDATKDYLHILEVLLSGP